MSEQRLRWLLVALSALLAARVASLIGWTNDPAPREAVVAPILKATKPVMSERPATEVTESAEPLVEIDEPRNAFVARRPPVLPTQPIAPVFPAPKPFVGPLPPPPPAPPPMPPLQVIGTWDDARGHSVFIAGPSGVRQVRQHDTLFEQYRIESITPAQVVVRDLSQKHEFQFAVPRLAGDSR